MATVSGPGSQPVRTLTDAAYGEQQTFRDIQQGAPMPQAGAPSPMDAAAGGPSPVPLSEPSQRPDEPVTAGAPVGPGPGPEVLDSPTLEGEARNLLPYLPMLESRANSAESSQTLRNIVQYLKGFK